MFLDTYLNYTDASDDDHDESWMFTVVIFLQIYLNYTDSDHEKKRRFTVVTLLHTELNYTDDE